MTGFTTAELPDLTGQTVIVTGASSGIGLETAKALTAHGARVVLAVRDAARGDKAAATLPGPGPHEVRLLDLASLESVRSFARDWQDQPVDLLINNAGVMIPPLTRTSDGFELQFGTNHLGHFALTNLLLPHVTGASSPSPPPAAPCPPSTRPPLTCRATATSAPPGSPPCAAPPLPAPAPRPPATTRPPAASGRSARS
jgi:NAD(P)-dependent dehydrogenase (short-subunit alcohol dehydrogenase family)